MPTACQTSPDQLVRLGQKVRRAIPVRRALLALPAPKVLSG